MQNFSDILFYVQLSLFVGVVINMLRLFSNFLISKFK